MSATFFDDVTTAIRTKVRDEIAVGGFTVQYDNEKDFAQPEGAAWARLSILFGEAAKVDTGSPSANRHRHVGTVILQVFHPLMTGMGEGWERVDLIKNAFLNATVGGAVFRTPRPSNVGRDGKWHQINVVCPFYVDDIA